MIDFEELFESVAITLGIAYPGREKIKFRHTVIMLIIIITIIIILVIIALIVNPDAEFRFIS